VLFGLVSEFFFQKLPKQCYQIWFWGLLAFSTDFVHKIGNKLPPTREKFHENKKKLRIHKMKVKTA
jgi:hypothetical protein